jgi:tetratricopeptide (TPR) repeat protein
VAPCENIYLENSSFYSVNICDTIFYKKNKLEKNSIIPAEKTEMLFNPECDVLNSEAKIGHTVSSPGVNYKSDDIRSEPVILEKKHIEPDDNDKGNLLEQARYYANQRKLDDAEEICRKLISSDKINPEYFYLLSNILQEQNKIDEAILTLKKVLYLDPNLVIAHFSLGNLYLIQGKSEEGNRYLSNALDMLNMIDDNYILEESGGLTALKLKEIINMVRNT